MQTVCLGRIQLMNNVYKYPTALSLMKENVANYACKYANFGMIFIHTRNG